MYQPMNMARSRLANAVRSRDPEAEAAARAAFIYAKAEDKILQALATLGSPTPEQRHALAALLLREGGEGK